MNREKLLLKTNIPTTFKVKYDTPKSGEGEYGPWFMWTVEEGGQDRSWFVSGQIGALLNGLGLKQDTMLTVTKMERDGSNVKDYVITDGKGVILVDTREKGVEEKVEEVIAPVSPPPSVEVSADLPPPMGMEENGKAKAKEMYYLVLGSLRLARKAYQEAGFDEVSVEEIGTMARTVFIGWPKHIKFPPPPVQKEITPSSPPASLNEWLPKFIENMGVMKDRVGEVVYYEALREIGDVAHCNAIRCRKVAGKVYKRLEHFAQLRTDLEMEGGAEVFDTLVANTIKGGLLMTETAIEEMIVDASKANNGNFEDSLPEEGQLPPDKSRSLLRQIL